MDNEINEQINYLEFSNATFYIIIVLLICIILIILYNNYYCSSIKSNKMKNNINILDQKNDINSLITNGNKNSSQSIFQKKYDLLEEIEDFHTKQDNYIDTL